MKMPHLNCGAMQPYGGALFDGDTRGLGPANLTCHCLLLETSIGLVLVDTGTVSRHAVDAARRLSPLRRAAPGRVAPRPPRAAPPYTPLFHDAVPFPPVPAGGPLPQDPAPGPGPGR